MSRTAFISHSSNDKTTGKEACRFLEKNGVLCWIAPRDVTPGKNYGAAILDAIDECKVFVLILSAHSNKSGQVVREVERAASANAIIIPFRIENVSPSRDLEFYVSSAHWLDASTRPLEKHLRELLKAIKDWQKSGVVPEDRAAPVAPSPSPLPTASPRPARSFSAWFGAVAAGSVALILCGIVAYKFLRYSPKQIAGASAPTPAETTTAVSAPSPSASVPLNFETATPMSILATAAPSATSSPLHRRPGEPLRSPSPSESSASPTAASSPSARMRPGQPITSNVPPTSPSPFPAPVIREVVASSELTLNGETRRPSFAFDGNPSTAWVTKADGVGQSISVHFKSPATISSVSILNSAAAEEKRYRTMPHVRTVRMKLSDGTVQMLTFEDKMEWQRFDLPQPKVAEWAKFEIVTVYPGTKFKTVPIAEIVFNRSN